MSEIGHSSIFGMSAECPVTECRKCRFAFDDVIRRVIQAPKLARRFLRYEPVDPERDVIKPGAPEQAAGIQGTRCCIQPLAMA